MEEWDVEKAEELSNQLATREVSQTQSSYLLPSYFSPILLFILKSRFYVDFNALNLFWSKI